MLRPIRITEPENAYFISDPHFNHTHKDILELRGVKDVEALNRDSIDRWNSVVPPDGEVFLLGDVCLHDPTGLDTKRLLRCLNGRVIYILWGNHNSGIKAMYRDIVLRQVFDGDKRKASKYEVYPVRSSIGKGQEVVFLGETVKLLWADPDRPGPSKDTEIFCHHYSQRSWEHNYNGSWMLCGHSHGMDPGTASKGDAGLGKILEVTYESIGRPLNILQIKEIMNRKKVNRGDREAYAK